MNIEPVVQIDNYEVEVGLITTRPVLMSESITGIGASDKIKPVLMVEQFVTEYIDETVLADDPVALADDLYAIAGALISLGDRPDALQVLHEKSKIQVEKEEPKLWQISQP